MTKAWRVMIDKIDGVGIVWAETASKARYRAYCSARDVFNVQLIEFKVRRVKEWDGKEPNGYDSYGTVVYSEDHLQQLERVKQKPWEIS